MVTFDGFDWDDGNREKCRKHGVSIEDIEAVLSDPDSLSKADAAHSVEEARMIAVGRTPAGRFVFVGFTFRRRDNGLLIRPISARYMHAKEIRRYGQGLAGV